MYSILLMSPCKHKFLWLTSLHVTIRDKTIRIFDVLVDVRERFNCD